MNNEKDFLSLGWRLANIEVESSDAIDMKWNKWPEVDPIHYNWHLVSYLDSNFDDRFVWQICRFIGGKWELIGDTMCPCEGDAFSHFDPSKVTHFMPINSFEEDNASSST